LWVTVRYIYRNPVEAKLVSHPAEYPWSSAGAHCNNGSDPYLTTGTPYANRLAARRDFHSWLESPEDVELIKQLKKATLRDRPTGSEEFLRGLEREYGIVALPPPLGRPKKRYSGD
jgi:putative transposase